MNDTRVVNLALILASIVMFCLAAFNVGVTPDFNIGWIGVGSFAASFIIP